MIAFAPQVIAHEASACAVCRFKTIFPLVGPTKR